MEKFDICIIGAGPGGYVSAIRASQLGLKVAIVEKQHLGGICLNWGCIPTKALLKSAEINHLLHNLDEYGFSAKEISFDFKKIIQRSRNVSKTLSNGISFLLKKNKVKIIDGEARFIDKNQINIKKDSNKEEKLSADYFVIATGARAKNLPNLEIDGSQILSYKEAMTLEKLPKSLLVVGSGAIGLEFASFYRNMGSEVSIVEIADRILINEDEEISSLAKKSFEKQKINIFTKTKIENLEKKASSVKIELSNKKVIEVEKVILAAGVVPNTEDLNLEKINIELHERKYIKTDKFLKTNQNNIFAIGDVVEGPWLAHKASHEGVIVAEKIASLKNKYDKNKIHYINKNNIPSCVYTLPQIASIGITETKAKELGYKINVGKFPYKANGKALAIGKTEGLIKVIFDKETGELLGAHLIGEEVTEMIQGYTIAKQGELTDIDLINTIFPHPTISESMHEAVLDSLLRTIHN